MRLLTLHITNFRGIDDAEIAFHHHDVLIGPNGVGKSTIVDALSLVFGRTKMVRDLTEHDFYGSCPDEKTRIRIIATMGEFESDSTDAIDTWFREGRAVPKWWNESNGEVVAEPGPGAENLCAQIAFAARFDVDELTVEHMRYFHDDDSLEDPFLSDVVQLVPSLLYDDIGYFVLPAQRTWEAAASFVSDLFRRTVSAVGAMPAKAIVNERDRLRNPEHPIEADPGVADLAHRINKRLSNLLPIKREFQLRVTRTDSDSLLRALIPHYTTAGNVSLPVSRHGLGLLALQSLVLLLELGQERRRLGKPFFLVMEEPELHIAPGLQRRLVAEAMSVAGQTICTTHSPRVATIFPATAIQVLDRRLAGVACTPLLPAPLDSNAVNAVRKLFHDNLSRTVEAAMEQRVLIPEGRCDYEWLHLLADTVEMSSADTLHVGSSTPPFGSILGVILTHDSSVLETYSNLRRVRGGLVPLVDGDIEGDQKIERLLDQDHPPETVVQWQQGWAIEDVIGWIVGADEDTVMRVLADDERVPMTTSSATTLLDRFRIKSGEGSLKTNYLAFEAVVHAIRLSPDCLKRAKQVLDALTKAALGTFDDVSLLTTSALAPATVLARISP